MRKILIIIFILALIFTCNKKDKNENIQSDQSYSKQTVNNDSSKPVDIEEKKDKNKNSIKVTFIELGSVNCVPCKMMQPVMKKIEGKYKGQVVVVFYDVWTDKDAPMADKYKIRFIPTQIFLDINGVEYFRHEGYFPFEELELILKQKGVN